MIIGSAPSENELPWGTTEPWSGWLLAFFLGGMVATTPKYLRDKVQKCVKALDTMNVEDGGVCDDACIKDI